MVLNDFRKDADHLFIDEGVTKTSIAEAMGVPKQSINAYMEYASINKKYVELIEALGYDIKVEYVKRDCGEGQK